MLSNWKFGYIGGKYMRLLNVNQVGNRLYELRKQAGMTQEEVASDAGMTARAYAEIERGKTGMRLDSLLGISKALKVTPNEFLTESDISPEENEEELRELLRHCTPAQRETANQLLSVYLKSLTR